MNKSSKSTIQFSKTEIGNQIEQWVTEGFSYLEATSRFLDENGLSENDFKEIPQSIIDKIKVESREENLLRPSFSKEQGSSLDFLL